MPNNGKSNTKKSGKSRGDDSDNEESTQLTGHTAVFSQMMTGIANQLAPLIEAKANKHLQTTMKGRKVKNPEPEDDEKFTLSGEDIMSLIDVAASKGGKGKGGVKVPPPDDERCSKEVKNDDNRCKSKWVEAYEEEQLCKKHGDAAANGESSKKGSNKRSYSKAKDAKVPTDSKRKRQEDDSDDDSDSDDEPPKKGDKKNEENKKKPAPKKPASKDKKKPKDESDSESDSDSESEQEETKSRKKPEADKKSSSTSKKPKEEPKEDPEDDADDGGEDEEEPIKAAHMWKDKKDKKNRSKMVSTPFGDTNLVLSENLESIIGSIDDIEADFGMNDDNVKKALQPISDELRKKIEKHSQLKELKIEEPSADDADDAPKDKKKDSKPRKKRDDDSSDDEEEKPKPKPKKK